MGLRTIGRWFYHTITSSEKRPYIKLSLDDLERLTEKATSSRDIPLLLDAFDELRYRITSPDRRDRATTQIALLLQEFEGIHIPPDADHNQIAEQKEGYFSRLRERDQEEKRRRVSEAKAKRVAEQKAKEAAAEKSRLEAEEKAAKEAEEKARKEAERKTQEAAVEKARLEAEAKARRKEEERKEAERQAKEAAVEKTRKEAKRKAQEAAAEKARLEAEAEKARLKAEAKAEQEAERKAEKAREEAAAEKARLEAEAKARQEAERKAQEEAAVEKARLEAERKIQEEVAAEQARQEAEAKAGEEAERKAQEEAAAEQARVEAEVGLTPGQDPNASRQLEERAEADARSDAASESFSQTPPAKGVTRRMSREEEKEERRELARLRKLEREGKAADQSEDELEEEDLDAEPEEAEQFAPNLAAMPAHWSDWSEQHWNIKLLDYCFVQKANEASSQGLPSTEEDLAFVTGDRDSAPADIAQALVDRVREFSFNHGLSPARLLIKRLETWDYKSPSPPRYFAFLWTTCLIAQGFPSPFEKGEFHKRYQRDDVFGANESQYLSSTLPAAWVQLSKWLDRHDIFDGQGHRRLVLPKKDPRRSIISDSWKLSFPCRADRKRLQDILERVAKDRSSCKSIDIQLISRIYHQGGFTPEFTAALKQQIDLMQSGNQTEEWLSAIIQREVEALGTSQVQTRGQGTLRAGNRSSPKIMLHLDDDDCYLELVLPSQSVAVEESWHLSHNAKYAISIEDEETQEQDIRQLNIECEQEEIIVPEQRKRVAEERKEYGIKLLHRGNGNAVLAEWYCEGLANMRSYILFDAETGAIITDNRVIGNSLSLLCRRSWQVNTSDGIEAETDDGDPISVYKLGKWDLHLLTKTSSQTTAETISLTCDSGEKMQIEWFIPGDQQRSSKPILKGLSLPGPGNIFAMMPQVIKLWLPPEVEKADITVYKVEDDELFRPLITIHASSSGNWQPINICNSICNPGHYSVKVAYEIKTSSKVKSWSKNFRLADKPDSRHYDPKIADASYVYRGVEKAVILGNGMTTLDHGVQQEFWNSKWIARGLWPHERIQIALTGMHISHRHVLSSDDSGSCDLSVSAFEPYFESEQQIALSIIRQGFEGSYELARFSYLEPTEQKNSYLNDSATLREPNIEKPVSRRIFVERMTITLNGKSAVKKQSELIEIFDEMLDRDFSDLEFTLDEYTASKGRSRVNGTSLIIVYSFTNLSNGRRDQLRVDTEQTVKIYRLQTGLDLSVNFSRERK